MREKRASFEFFELDEGKYEVTLTLDDGSDPQTYEYPSLARAWAAEGAIMVAMSKKQVSSFLAPKPTVR